MIDLESIAKQLTLDLLHVQRVAELLEEGNTIPFITRFRKDQIGGLDEQRIRHIQERISRAKLLAERKETILKSVESRGKLTDSLAAQIRGAKQMGELEDLYLPYKPKKQSLASIARARGLEPLAKRILDTVESGPAIEELAKEFVSEENELADVETVVEGLRHLVAEHYSHHRELRSQLRRRLSKNGRLVSKKMEQTAAVEEEASSEEGAGESESTASSPTVPDSKSEDTPDLAEKVVAAVDQPSDAQTGEVESKPAEPADEVAVDVSVVEKSVAESCDGVVTESPSSETSSVESNDRTSDEMTPSAEVSATDAEPTATEAPKSDVSSPNDNAPDAKDADPAPQTDSTTPTAGPAKATKPGKPDAKSRRDQRREMRRRRRERLVQSFKDYFDFSDPISKLPHHRILAINRGERTKVLRVKIECPDWDKVQAEAENVVPKEHPYAEFLLSCLRDAVQRSLQPSIERELRRDLNDRAEEHAVKVFARNLRKLLLQPPLRKHRVVAIDPGFRSGCKIVALDEFGQMLGHTFVNLLGKDQQKQSGRDALAKFVAEHKASVIAVGNGAACRETETLVAEVLNNELKDHDVAYLIVNEAGTSVYSTSELGREELPDVDATVRSAVSIGRRSLDPLSELVKIDPASIGVGLYQHDVKAKHLRESLDGVVESCVNYVGVDVNSASPALLRYVSGLNSLTARKIYEYRQEHGPFKNREELKQVSGIGESTYVQAAGFLKISGGENPLDGTWIHPESYETATKVLDALGFSPADLETSTKSPVVKTETENADSPDASTETPLAVEPDGPPAPPPESDSSVVNEDASAAMPSDRVASEVTPEVSEDSQSADTLTAAEKTPEQVPTSPTEDPTPVESSPADPSNASEPVMVPETASSSKELIEKLATVDIDQLAPTLDVGKLSLRDILDALAKPGRDPREDLPPPVFRKGILKLEDLKPEMELSGTVLNVVDFGAFVDIGLVDSGLIHVSRLADRYVSDPHDVVSVGDILHVWVVDVDQKRRRVSLTAIKPGTEKPKPPKEKRRRPPRAEKQSGGKPKRPPRKGKPKQYKPKAPPKPVVPITKEMEDGSEPMRTFGDLKQLFDKKRRGSK